MSFFIQKKIRSDQPEVKNILVASYFDQFAKKLVAYTRKNYVISEDDTWAIVYRTIYKMAEINDQYQFSDVGKKNSFVFRTHINFIKNHFRDNKSFEYRHREVDLPDFIQQNDPESVSENIPLQILNRQLEKMEEWQRILLLMRGQNMPYSEISAFVNKPEQQLKVYYARLKMQLLDQVNQELKKLNSTPHEKQ